MSWWKKFLIYLSVIIGISLIVFFVFFAITINYKLPEMTYGRYNLIKVAKVIDDQEEIIEEYSAGEYYIVIKEGLELVSYSQDKGITENEAGHGYFLHANELVIFLQTEEADIACGGYYYPEANTIKVFSIIDEITYYYYYQLTEPNE